MLLFGFSSDIRGSYRQPCSLKPVENLVGVRYLLPCTNCGKQIPVEARQAGDEVRCPCGRTTTVPRLLELRRLPEERAAESSNDDRRPAWGAKQRTVMVGAIVTLIALCFAGWRGSTWPQSPIRPFAEEKFQAALSDISPAQSWGYWLFLRESGLSPVSPREWEAYENALTRAQIALAVAIAFALAGLAVVVVGVFWVGSSDRTPSASD